MQIEDLSPTDPLFKMLMSFKICMAINTGKYKEPWNHVKEIKLLHELLNH